MRAEYDFSGGVRGKHAAAYQQGHSVTIHEKDGTTVVQNFKLEEDAVIHGMQEKMKRHLNLVVSSILITIIIALAGCRTPPSTSSVAPTTSHEVIVTPIFVPSPTIPSPIITPTSITSTDSHSGIIAFSSNRDGNVKIYAMHEDGNDVTNLIDNAFSPAWSPDGTRIVFESSHGGKMDMQMLDLKKNDIVNLALTMSHNFLYPEWSPDGKRIAFQYYLDSLNSDIYVLNTDGGQLTNLTMESGSGDVTPVWSPDGKKIAFVTNRNAAYDIYVMDADGSNLTNLTTNNEDANYPAWSPDGTKIAFQSHRNGKDGIYLMNADGNDEILLATDTSYHHPPVWSPDGTRIAFLSLADGNGEIYVVNADGSNPTNLTRNSSGDNSPAWSPDGTKIVFVSN
ncbi:MAG: DPP IV N-terminal domain-containing protein, partial [Anaerolineae bacterium]|nr:DPP IV N-terminal domain-containing protein [Anaerolineae bacterium]